MPQDLISHQAPLGVIRCDASNLIGFGHVMRCRALARELARKGYQIIFLCVKLPIETACILRSEFTVIEISDTQLSGSLTADTGESMEQVVELRDANKCVDRLKSYGIDQIDLLICDNYDLSHKWHEAILHYYEKRSGKIPRLLVLDDLANRRYSCDILLDSGLNESVGDEIYKMLVPSSCKLLVGPRYAVISHEFRQLRINKRSTISIEHVFIYFGGSETNLIELTLKVLIDMFVTLKHVDVVLGQCHEDDYKKLTERWAGHNIIFHINVRSLAQIMVSADLAIGAAGSTSWERCCLGLPSIVTTIADNQSNIASMLDEAGASIVINNSADETYEAGLRSTLMRIMANFSILGEIAKCSKSLCDGRGVERVVFGLINHKRSDFQVRKATIDDLDLYHSWRNEPTTRKWSFNSDHIAFDIHAEWFRHKCSSPNALLFVMTERNGLEVGQIRFERELGSSAESIVSFSLDPMARGKRLSTVLIELGLEKVKMSWPNLSTCLAQVKLGNHSSVRALKLAGFKPLPSIEDGIINLLFRF